WMVTGELFHPLAFGAGETAAVMVGALESMLTPESVAGPMLPARSTAWPDADRPTPSADSVTGAVRLPGATPESASVAAKLTTTGTLLQPFAFACGARMAVTTGGVL